MDFGDFDGTNIYCVIFIEFLEPENMGIDFDFNGLALLIIEIYLFLVNLAAILEFRF